MSISAAQADAFVSEVRQNGSVWAIRDDKGFPTSTNPSGKSAMPFWSLESRAQRIVDTVPAYRDFRPDQIAVAEFIDHWLPGLQRDELLVGLNWSGERATGYDLSPADLRARLNAVDTSS